MSKAEHRPLKSQLQGQPFRRGQKPPTYQRVYGSGPVPCDVMLIGERPGRDEDASGEPFVGLAGQELNRYLGAGGLGRGRVYITNLVKTYRDGDPPSEDEVALDGPELLDEIEIVGPMVIGAMGRHAVRYFMGDVNMEDVHGVPVWWTHPTYGPVILVPIFHPAAGFYDAETQPTILDDFARLGRVVSGDLAPFEDNLPRHYIRDHGCHFGPLEGPIALDTEGWLRRPWGLSCSHRPGWGIVIQKDAREALDWLAWRIEQAEESDPNFVTYVHNYLHDAQVLEALGVRLREDKFIDTMVLAYILKLEPQALKALAYRHLGVSRPGYMDVVGPYYSAVFEEYIRTAAELPLPYSDEYVVIVNGEPKVKRPWGINRHLVGLVKALDEGKPIDLPARWKAIDEYKTQQVIEMLGPIPEPSLDLVPDDESIPYSAADADDTRRLGPILASMVAEMDMGPVASIDHSVLPMLDRMQRIGFKANPDHFDALAAECTEGMIRIQAEIEAMTGAMINPNSGDQVADLIFDQLQLPWTKLTKSKSRPSTNDKVLEALRFEHPVMPLIMDYRELSKIRGSFCIPISLAARRTPDRRIHCNIRATRVESGRLSATDPNLLAIPVRSAIGRRVREGFVPEPGHVLATWDQDQIEMREMADQSADPVLCGAFNNGIDIHSNTASLIFGIPYEDILHDKALRKKLRDPAKRAGFGVITGITGMGLKDQMDLANSTKDGIPIEDGGTRWSEDDCDKLILEWFRVYRGVKVYLDNCRAEALRYGYVKDRWGRIRYLPGAHSPIPRIREEALRQSHSHKISASAQGTMKQCMKAIWDRMKEYWAMDIWIEPLLQIHDELVMELDEADWVWELVDGDIRHIMSTTVQYRVPLGSKGGRGINWADLEK